ncbi:MAG: single-stranded-DNA-specific exonuclease RecJ [Alphaproteobacteria bacterium]|nr:single-stranded-DNA-specific exonuclease RecJ [Alphaproteobacteria bacterium]
MAHKAAVKAAPHEAAAFLNVERSLTDKRWRARAFDEALAAAHQRRFDLPEVAARLLAARGVGLDEAPGFLQPTLRDVFPDPSTFIDMDKAAAAIEDAIVSGRPTAVFCDYDVDGGTSGAQLVRYFRARGRELRTYVPDRLTEGYGPSAAAFAKLKGEGVDLVITVDCGAAAEAPLQAAAEMGLDVIVLDHHLMSGAPPPALAVVNPNRPDCPSGHGALTAAGVVLVTLAAVNREARKHGSVGSNHLPNPIDNLDLSALGTVCDVAPLRGFNRAIVSQGLKILAQNKNIGLAALAGAAGKASCSSVYDLGFVLGPRINAGGRIGDASLGVRLLSTEDREEAEGLAAQLDALNGERRRQEADMIAEALIQAEAEARDRPVVVVGSPRWHPGVIGIAAGRLKDKVLKPVIVLGGESGAPAKGSGRSIPGVNLGEAVAAAAREGVALAGGGHAMAAGLTVAWDQVETLKDFLSDRLRAPIAAAAGAAREMEIDAQAGLRALNLDLLTALDRIGPYGPGHPEPVLAIPDVRASYASEVKGGHVRLVLEDAYGAKARGIAFRAADSALGEALLSGARIHAAVKLKRNDWGGSVRAEIELVDAAEA